MGRNTFGAAVVLAVALFALAACSGDRPGAPGAAAEAANELHHGQPATAPARAAIDATAPIPDQISFNRHVRPILSDTCFACHGPDIANRKANLSLHTLAEASRDLGGGRRAIVPGDPDASELLKRVVHEDPRERMPPVALGKTLSPRDVEILRRWIKAGAEYEEHWAYLQPKRYAPPEVPAALAARVENPIDRFVFAKLAEARLEPAAEADKRTLIRRVSLDLTGLPPTPQEVDAFLADRRPDAYERLVDRLLASPHYGERMALHWLDAVRYADTWGFHADQNREVWPYRDYVIAAFNENKPFDRFTIEQVAGDLLPRPSRDAMVATTFTHLNKITAEGGAQSKEYLARYMMDRVSTVGTAWLGQTMGCAECHDHKYDPIAAEDVYSMQAFFADLQEEGKWNDPWDALYAEEQYPIMYLGSPAEMAKLASLKAAVERTAARSPWRVGDAGRPRMLAGFDRWLESVRREAAARPNVWRPLKITSLETVDHPPGRVTPQGGLAFDHVVALEKSGIVRLSATGDLGPAVSVLRFDVTTSGPDAEQELKFLSVWEVRATVRGPDGRAQSQDTLYHTSSGRGPEQPALQNYATNPGPQRYYFRGFERTVSSHAGLKGKYVTFVLDRPIPVPAGGVLEVEVALSTYDGEPGGEDHGQLPNVTLSVTDMAHPGANLEEVRRLAAKPAASWTAEERTLLENAYLAYAPEHFAAHKAFSDAERAYLEFADSLPSTWVAERRAEPRPIRVLPRGDWQNDTGELVAPSIPAYLGGAPKANGRATRLDLARWLVSDENPLTARVQVNRMWAQFFGAGIARTLNDFGSQGEWPTHPELLDWLALEYRDGWDTKAFVRLLVTSATYKQSTVASAEALEKDVQNRLFSRQNLIRLPAEVIRDNALSIAGLLNRDIGGPSIRPYQPEGYYGVLNFPRRVYVASEGGDQFRRGLYMHWQRTRLHPFLKAFDAPSREESVMARANSNTPLQALALLNDPVFVEISETFGETLLRKAGDDEARLRYAFERAVARPPEAEELALLSAALEQARAQFSGDPASAREFLALGERQAPQDIPPAELAAWTSVARVVLNLHETITRS